VLYIFTLQKNKNLIMAKKKVEKKVKAVKKAVPTKKSKVKSVKKII